MRAIRNDSVDPYFNIASDEFLVASTDGDAFMLWQNSPAVIIGKNQNAWAEVDRAYTEENNIAVVRRITGGGAVYHDLGNVNFSFVTPASDGSKLNFAKFCAPVIRALSRMGIDAALDGRNDVVACGVKISGNAECVVKNRHGYDAVLHHGTLLFSADLSALSRALTPSREKLSSRGIKSVSSRVGNIVDLPCYAGPRDVRSFMDALADEIAPHGMETFAADEIGEIERLRGEKFATWGWNWGASPAFETTKRRRFPFGTLEAPFDVRGGIIEKIKITGDFFGDGASALEDALAGARLEAQSISSSLTDGLVSSCISGAAPRDIAELLTKEETP